MILTKRQKFVIANANNLRLAEIAKRSKTYFASNICNDVHELVRQGYLKEHITSKVRYSRTQLGELSL